mmetsp:Transcript_49052/g.101313  ORF Transcript_49052/g.101313 Transcript_49052/m.101313 type:complete len:407 (-) Transcript_49052:489-1709(-)
MRLRSAINLFGLVAFLELVAGCDSFGLRSFIPSCRMAFVNQIQGCLPTTTEQTTTQLSFSTAVVEKQKDTLVEDTLSPRTIAMNIERHEGAVLACENMYPWYNFTGNDFEDAGLSVVESWDEYSHDHENEGYDHVLHRPRFPFGLDDLARASREPLLTKGECQILMDEADGINEDASSKEWMEGGARYGTPSDKVGALMPLERLPKSFEMINKKLLPRIFSSVVKAFDGCADHPSDLRLGGARVVRYDAAEGQVELGMHRDFLALTVNIALNDPSEFEGGGTVVEALSKTPIRLEQGHALIHPGDVRHAGSSITSGSRYVLVLFLMSKTIVPHDRYVGEWAQQCMGLAANSQADEKDHWLRTAARYYADAYALGGRIDRGLFPWFYQRAGLGIPEEASGDGQQIQN